MCAYLLGTTVFPNVRTVSSILSGVRRLRQLRCYYVSAAYFATLESQLASGTLVRDTVCFKLGNKSCASHLSFLVCCYMILQTKITSTKLPFRTLRSIHLPFPSAIPMHVCLHALSSASLGQTKTGLREGNVSRLPIPFSITRNVSEISQGQ